MQGNDYKLYLTANGLIGGTQKLVGYQGDSDINTGVDLATSVYKGRLSYTTQTFSGFTIDCKVLLEAPLGDGAQLLVDAHANGDTVYAYLQSDTTDAQYWHGKFKVAMTTVPTAVSGNVEAAFKLASVGEITQDVTV